MVETKDPMLEVFRKREDADFVEAQVQQLERESEARRSKNPRKKPKNPKKRPKQK